MRVVIPSLNHNFKPLTPPLRPEICPGYHPGYPGGAEKNFTAGLEGLYSRKPQGFDNQGILYCGGNSLAVIRGNRGEFPGGGSQGRPRARARAAAVGA